MTNLWGMAYIGKLLLVLVLVIQVPKWEFAILLNYVYYRKILDCLIAGCNCHLSHLAASKGGPEYHNKTGFNKEKHQVDLYSFFKKSTCRKGILAHYTEFVGCEKCEEITGYIFTRWLSLEQCCDRETKRFEALKSIFYSEDKKDSIKRFKRLSNGFADPLTVACSFFYCSFTNFHKL